MNWSDWVVTIVVIVGIAWMIFLGIALIVVH